MAWTGGGEFCVRHAGILLESPELRYPAGVWLPQFGSECMNMAISAFRTLEFFRDCSI